MRTGGRGGHLCVRRGRRQLSRARGVGPKPVPKHERQVAVVRKDLKSGGVLGGLRLDASGGCKRNVARAVPRRVLGRAPSGVFDWLASSWSTSKASSAPLSSKRTTRV